MTVDTTTTPESGTSIDEGWVTEYGESDIYSNPGKYGYTLVGSVDDLDASYSFDITAVWRRERDGALFWAHDLGCSCPSPFEDYRSVADLTPIVRQTFPEFEEHMRSLLSSESRRYDQTEVSNLIEAVLNLL